MSPPSAKTAARRTAEEALLDAAERLLVDVGYAGITTRTLAEEAGVNHGLVHYYFGSNENLLVRALERFTERLIDRQRALYAADVPFIDKWRTAMRYLVERRLHVREGLARAAGDVVERPRPPRAPRPRQWRVAVVAGRGLRGAASASSGFAMPLEALVSLVMTFNLGMIVERLGGVETGHPSSWNGSTNGSQLTAATTDQTRARYPDESASVRARRRPARLRGVRLRGSRRSC